MTDGPRLPEVLLCDADGTLFDSEQAAFDVSVHVTNRLMAECGIARRHSAHELRVATSGRNFRGTATELLGAGGVTLDPDALEQWVQTERREVAAHLGATLVPDPRVREPLVALRSRTRLAVVTSSAASRVDACLAASRLDDLFESASRFSAEDSLPAPESKPSPAIYRHALAALGVDRRAALAVEDAVPGVQSAVAAGIPVLGFVMFVPVAERDDRAAELLRAGAERVLGTWDEVSAALAGDLVAAP